VGSKPTQAGVTPALPASCFPRRDHGRGPQSAGDRELTELLDEIPVVLPGAQVPVDRDAHYAALLGTALGTVVLTDLLFAQSLAALWQRHRHSAEQPACLPTPGRR